MPLIKREALQWGIPWQIGAGLFDAEQQLDWKRKNEQRELAYNNPLLNLALASRGNPAGGVANMHADTARAVAKYFAGYESLTQCLHWQLPISQNEANLVVVNVLRSRENSIRMMTAYVRDLADYRFGSNKLPLKTAHSNLSEWTLADAVAIWQGYRYGVPRVAPEGQGLGFRSIEDFQNRKISLDQLIHQVIIGAGDAQESASESIPIFEKYMQMQ